MSLFPPFVDYLAVIGEQLGEQLGDQLDEKGLFRWLRVYSSRCFGGFRTHVQTQTQIAPILTAAHIKGTLGSQTFSYYVISFIFLNR